LLFLFLFFENLFYNRVFSESVAVALDIDHFAVMKQPVQYGSGNDRIAKQFLPVTEALVGSDNDGVPFGLLDLAGLFEWLRLPKYISSPGKYGVLLP
jgi:hypothetical protein